MEYTGSNHEGDIKNGRLRYLYFVALSVSFSN